MRQAYVCNDASEITMKDMGKNKIVIAKQRRNTTKQARV